MFISNEEKINIKSELGLARSQISGLISAVSALTKRLDGLERAAIKPQKPKKTLTAAQKNKQRAYQKAYNERQKAKKLAAQGNTNGS